MNKIMSKNNPVIKLDFDNENIYGYPIYIDKNDYEEIILDKDYKNYAYDYKFGNKL